MTADKQAYREALTVELNQRILAEQRQLSGLPRRAARGEVSEFESYDRQGAARLTIDLLGMLRRGEIEARD